MSRRKLCPYQDIDWEINGGLVNCNWPCCIQGDSGKFECTFRVIEDERTVITLETDVSPALPPICMIGLFSFFPVITLAFVGAAAAGYITVSAWTFNRLQDSLVLTGRVKYVCAEKQEPLLRKVHNAFVEHTMIESEETGERLLRGRLVVYGISGESSQIDQVVRICSPWKTVQDESNHDYICQRILDMIPIEDIRADVGEGPAAISSPFMLRRMIRDAVPALASHVTGRTTAITIAPECIDQMTLESLAKRGERGESYFSGEEEKIGDVLQINTLVCISSSSDSGEESPWTPCIAVALFDDETVDEALAVQATTRLDERYTACRSPV